MGKELDELLAAAGTSLGPPKTKAATGAPALINVIYPNETRPRAIPATALLRAKKEGARLATYAETEENRKERAYGDRGGTAFLEGAADAISFGATAELRQSVDPEATEEVARRNSGYRLAGEIGGAILNPFSRGLSKGATAAGGAVEKGLAKVGAGSIIAKTAARGATGAIEGVGGQTIVAAADARLTDDPFDWENYAKSLPTAALFGAGANIAVPAVIGLVKKGAEQVPKVLKAAVGVGKKVDGTPTVPIPDDIAAIRDVKAAKAQIAVEKAAVKDAHVETVKAAKVERDAALNEAVEVHEAARSSRGAELAAKAKAHNKEYFAEGGFAGYKGNKEAQRVSAGAAGRIRAAADELEGLAANPGKLLDPLRRRRGALRDMLAAPEKFRSDTARAAIEKALRNDEELIAAIDAHSKTAIKKGMHGVDASSVPITPRLQTALDALTTLEAGGAKESSRLLALMAHVDDLTSNQGGIMRGAVKGGAFTAATGALTGLGVPFPLAMLGGAKAAQLADDLLGRAGVFRKLERMLAREGADSAKRLDDAVAAAIAPKAKVVTGAPFGAPEGAAAKAARKAAEDEEIAKAMASAASPKTHDVLGKVAYAKRVAALDEGAALSKAEFARHQAQLGKGPALIDGDVEGLRAIQAEYKRDPVGYTQKWRDAQRRGEAAESRELKDTMGGRGAKGTPRKSRQAQGTPEGSRQADYRERAAELRESVQPGPSPAPGVAGKPDLTPKARADIREALHGVRLVSAKVADGIERHIARKLVYLYGALPQKPGTPVPRFGPDKWQPDDEALSKFERKAAVAENYEIALAQIIAGKFTPDSMEALKAVWPEVYTRIQQALVANLAELRENLSYSKRLMMSIFFGVPLDEAVVPEVLGAIQAVHTQSAIANQPPAPRGGASNRSTKADTNASKAQRLQAR